MDMWELAADLGLDVIEYRGTHKSGYLPGDRTIRLRPGMTSRVTRSVLAHEIGHHILGHTPTQLGPIRARQERSANEWAALRLITADDYAEVEELHAGNTVLMSSDLHVADELLAAYQALLTRIEHVV